MLKFFMQFLRQSLLIEDSKIVVRVSCYLGNGLSQEEIENYWLELLELSPSCLRKTLVNLQPRSSQQKGRKLKYGMCRVGVYNVRHVQHVLGAIQEYAGIDKPEWLL